jgi:hypothetical protein
MMFAAKSVQSKALKKKVLSVLDIATKHVSSSLAHAPTARALCLWVAAAAIMPNMKYARFSDKTVSIDDAALSD